MSILVLTLARRTAYHCFGESSASTMWGVNSPAMNVSGELEPGPSYFVGKWSQVAAQGFAQGVGWGGFGPG